MLREPDAWRWWTFWQVVLAPEGESVGLVDFKGPPGPEGGVAIGCSFAPAHWDRGYATEAVAPLVAWALGHSSVRFVAAETDVRPTSGPTACSGSWVSSQARPWPAACRVMAPPVICSHGAS